MLITELKSEAVKERHWKQLMRRLHVNWVLSELTLGHLWDVDLQKNEAVIRDVLAVAQGEMALEEFLKQVSREMMYISNYFQACPQTGFHIFRIEHLMDHVIFDGPCYINMTK